MTPLQIESVTHEHVVCVVIVDVLRRHTRISLRGGANSGSRCRRFCDQNFLAPELQIALSFIIELSIEHQVRRDPAALRRSPSGEWP